MSGNLERRNDFFFTRLRFVLHFLVLLANSHNVLRILNKEMGKLELNGRWKLMIVVLQLWFLLIHSEYLEEQMQVQDNYIETTHGVQLRQQDQHVVMSNGLVNLTLTVPEGHITSVTYKGSDNLLETNNTEDDRGYWNIVWNKPRDHDIIEKFSGTSYKVIVKNQDHTEISFTTKWTVSSTKVPLNVDKRYVMLKGSPGFYTYCVLEKSKGWPEFLIEEGRIVLKLQKNKFHFMAMSEDRQRIMPMPDDRKTGQFLDYEEAVLLTRPTNPQLKGEVDDKYVYSCDNKDNKVHGWVSSNPSIGFWMITPSNEFRTGGPFKQDLTAHAGPTLLNMFISAHYVGEYISMKFQQDEYWKKVLGPVYVYLNSHPSTNTNPSILWNDAKQRMQKEITSWPYNFPLSEDFLKSKQRGTLRGVLQVRDRYNKKVAAATSAYVGLALPGDPGSWQLESKGYQFWTQADHKGNFLIKNIVPGKYSLFASVPGIFGDYKHPFNIDITPGSNVDVKNVIFEAPRNGPTLWEIGIPDRTSAEFFIPDSTFKIYPYPHPVEKFRQYGLWKRYKDYYPRNDVVYTVGRSNFTKDWFFAHVTRNVRDREFQPTTWQIQFNLKNINKKAVYTLQLALASANNADIHVHVNNLRSDPIFSTGLIGKDNALARHGSHGLYHSFTIGIPGSRLVNGNNIIFLIQSRAGGPFDAVMYDYIRFEGPS